MNRVFIDKVENGWVLTYSSYGAMKTEIYTDEEALLTRVHQIVSLKWDAGDKAKITKEEP